MMFCGQCNKDASECTCDDFEARLDEAVAGGHFAYKRCSICKKHYARCKCEIPIWEFPGADTKTVAFLLKEE